MTLLSPIIISLSIISAAIQANGVSAKENGAPNDVGVQSAVLLTKAPDSAAEQNPNQQDKKDGSTKSSSDAESNPSKSELATFKKAFDSLRQHPVEAAMLASKLAERQPPLPKPLLANVLWIQGSGLSISEDHKQALAVLSQAELLAREIRDTKLLRRILRYKSASALECSEFSVGQAAAEEAIALSHKMHDDSAYLATLHNELAGNEAGLGNSLKAIEHFHKALEISRRTGDVPTELQVLVNLGQIFADMNRPEDVIEINKQVLAKEGEGLDPQSLPVITAHVSLGESYLTLGKLAEAESHLQTARKMCNQPGSEAVLGSAEAALGRYFFANKDVTGARQHFTASLQIFESLENASGIAAAQQALRNLAAVDSIPDDSTEARIAEIQNQLLQAEAAKNQELVISLHRELADNLELTGDWQAATVHLKTAAELDHIVRNNKVDDTIARLLSEMQMTHKEQDLARLRHESELNSHRIQAQERWNTGLITCVLTMFAVIVAIGWLLSQKKKAVRELSAAHDELREQRRLQINMERRLAEQQKSQSLELMASGIAHDFNNLLAGIAGLAELGSQTVAVGRKNELLRQIASTTLQASGLTGQLQQFLGKPGQEVGLCDVTDVVESTKCLLQSVARPVALTLRGGHGAIHAEIDETRLRQVLVNLVANAAEASRPDGQVTVSVAKVDLTAADLQLLNCEADVQPGDYCRICVEDNGHGMSEETKRRLFDPYFTTKTLGRGLGLSSVMGILRSCRGIISVDSQPDAGCCITIWLRITNSSPAPENSSSNWANKGEDCDMNSECPAATSARILLVDDELLLLDLQSEFLGTLGYEVVVASSAEEALSAFRKYEMKFDCVVTDFSMPGRDGQWLAEQLTSVKPGLPVILCSGYASVENSSDQKSPITCELAKPFSPRVLSQKILECIQAVSASDSSCVVSHQET